MSKLKIETGSSPAGERFSITVTEKGPYLVYGRPPLAEQFIMPNENNESWYFQEGRHFSTEAEPISSRIIVQTTIRLHSSKSNLSFLRLRLC